MREYSRNFHTVERSQFHKKVKQSRETLVRGPESTITSRKIQVQRPDKPNHNFAEVQEAQCGKTKNLVSPRKCLFRQINSLVISLVKTLLSQNFCQKCETKSQQFPHCEKDARKVSRRKSISRKIMIAAVKKKEKKSASSQAYFLGFVGSIPSGGLSFFSQLNHYLCYKRTRREHLY